jgi:hypothetical protein
MKVRLFLCMVVLAGVAAAGDQKGASGMVDSGTFNILVNGKRVATETFRMEQKDGMNVVTSELRADTAEKPAVQQAEMKVASDGNLKRYHWKETSPRKAELSLEPQDAFFVMNVSEKDGTPSKQSTHPLSGFTSILDDNFFSQLQVLAWKYMALGCKPAPTGGSVCVWSEQKLPIFNPHQQQSQLITAVYLGLRKVTLNGAAQDYHALTFKAEAGEWMAWMDQKNRLVRVLIPGENTEVLRD